MKGLVHALAGQHQRDRLSGASSVAACPIGLEADISPTDRSVVHIVLSRPTPDSAIGRREIDALLYFGQAETQSDSGGIAAACSGCLTLVDALNISATNCLGILLRSARTITEEDRNAGHKLMALRVAVRGWSGGYALRLGGALLALEAREVCKRFRLVFPQEFDFGGLQHRR